MSKIAVCDDERKQLDLMQAFLTKYKQEHPHHDFTVTVFDSSLELLSYVEESGGFDIYLLDVYMAGFLGTQAAKQLRQQGDKGEIIFITSSRDHALNAFEVEAKQYLVKPLNEHDLFQVLDHIFERLTVERRHFVNIKTTQGFVRIYTRDVVFTEPGRNNYQLIHLNNKSTVEVRMTSTELFEFLVPAKFMVRVGASIIMNMKYVRQITKETIFFDTGERITYPYRAYPKLKEAFLSFQLSSEK